MSRDPNQKPNPLDNFRSVSYHHLLLVSNNTDALAPFINSTEQFDKSGIIIDRTDLSSLRNTLDNLQLGEDLNGIYKVIDTRKDAHFNIRDIHYTSYIGAMIPGQTQVMGGELNLVVHDPMGINFLNYLQDLIDNKLKCNYDGMCFLLKTFFIGHPDDGSDDVLVSTSANPLFLTNISAEFNETGGVYSVVFAPLTKGAIQQMSRTANIRNITGFKSKDGTLGSMVKSLQDELNGQLKDYYDTMQVVQVADGGITEEINSKRSIPLGRRVYYMITIPDAWASYPIQASSDNAIEVEWKQKIKDAEKSVDQKVADYNKSVKPDSNGKVIGASYIQGSVTMTVDDALALIFKHCPKVAEMAGIDKRKGTNGQSVKMYKTVSSLTSDSKSMTLHWDVLEFIVPNISVKAEKNSAYKKWFTKADDGSNVPKNLYTYDYIFSGKNIDIIRFDMKLANASIALLTGSNVGQKSLQTIASSQKDGGLMESKVKHTDVYTQRTNDPVFLPMVNASNFRGNSYIVDGSQLTSKTNDEYVRTMADLYSAAQVDIKMRIRGNPKLMNHVTTGIPPHVEPDMDDKLPINTNSSNKTDGTKQSKYIEYIKKYSAGVQEEIKIASNTGDDSTIDPAVFPIFTKVNVYAPKSYRASDITTDGYGEKFWYDKYYMVRSIEHYFVDGHFEQELVMGSYNIYDNEVSDSALEATATATKSPDKTENATANNQEKTKAGSGIAAPTAPGQPAQQNNVVIPTEELLSTNFGNASTTDAATSGTENVYYDAVPYSPSTNKQAITTGSAIVKKGS